MSGVPQDSIYPLLAINQKVVGEVIVKTIFDQQAKDFLQLLLSSKQNFNIQILSGDPDPQAGQSLQALDPRRMTYLGQLTPEQKANLVTEGSLYIGDGLNDTLALSKAAVSCRVGSRVLGFAPVDLQLQIPDLKNIFRIFQYAKKYRRVQMQNIALAFSYNLIALSLAAFGHFSPLGAVLAMAISFSLLTGNSLRLFSFSRRVK